MTKRLHTPLEGETSDLEPAHPRHAIRPHLGQTAEVETIAHIGRRIRLISH